MMRGRYPLNQSPLYRCTTRRKLAAHLKVDVGALDEIANAPDYRPVTAKNGREVLDPGKRLKIIQRRFADLLGRIHAPSYLNSAYKGTSYISNAAAHFDTGVPMFKVDIKKFFPNAQAVRVVRLFERAFDCSPDVAAISAKLTTFQGRLPTGGCTSTILSYWAYAQMFDEIYTRASEAGVMMTLCVDDMTFSGTRADSSLKSVVEKIVRSYGLTPHKQYTARAGKTRIITGVAVTPNGLRIKNEARQALHGAHDAVDAEKDVQKKFKLAQILLGRAVQAASIELRFQADVRRASEKLRDARNSALGAGFIEKNGNMIKPKTLKRPNGRRRPDSVLSAQADGAPQRVQAEL